MTHKIKVQMFGNFRMDYNGAPFVAEKMHKESQFNRMMQALIHYSDCGIAKDKLEEIVIGERDIDAPHTALRVIVYRQSKSSHSSDCRERTSYIWREAYITGHRI